MHLGEVKGDPSGLLKEYGEAQIRTAKTMRTLKGAMIYPGAVMGLALMVCGVLFYFVLPTMEALYLGLQDMTGGQIPWLTRAMLGFSRFLISKAGLTLLVVVVGSIIYGPQMGPRHRTRNRAKKITRVPARGRVAENFSRLLHGALDRVAD